jgi:hypothetical protein
MPITRATSNVITDLAITTAKLDDLSVTNAKISASAAIATSKLAPVTSTGSTTPRALQDRFADVVNVKDFGAVGDGVANDTAAFQAVLNIPASAKTISCLVPQGNYLLSSSPTQGIGSVFWKFEQGSTLLGGGVLPFTPQKIQLNGTPDSATFPFATYIQGTPSVPRTDLNKKTPSIYIERHTNSNPSDSSDWGNPRNSSPLEIESIIYGNETGSQNGLIARVFSAFAKAAGSADQTLTGASFLAQSNAPAGQNNRDCWAQNLVAASSSGLAPTNLVGVETDIIPSQAMPLLRPDQAGAYNATAYWAQAASGTSNCNTGVYVSSADATYGWLYGAVFNAPFYDYIAYFRTSLNAPSSKGVRIETQWGANTGRVLECFAGAEEQFRVDGANDNACWLRVNGSLKQVVVGAPDSAGVGFRTLRVTN